MTPEKLATILAFGPLVVSTLFAAITLGFSEWVRFEESHRTLQPLGRSPVVPEPPAIRTAPGVPT